MRQPWRPLRVEKEGTIGRGEFGAAVQGQARLVMSLLYCLPLLLLLSSLARLCCVYCTLPLFRLCIAELGAMTGQ